MVKTTRPWESGRATASAAALILGLVSSCAAPTAPEPDLGPATEYERLESIDTDDRGFEIPPEVTPAHVLPADLIEGDYHVVGDVVKTNGFTNTYRVESEFGDFEVHGTDLLRKLVHELEMLGALKEHEVSNPKVYALALANAAEGPIEGAAQLITRPAKTLIGIPKGMWSYGKRVVGMFGGDRGQYEDAYGKELVGFSIAKRSWAYRLGVDVYSSNEILQETLNKYAWSSFAGGLTVRLPLSFVSGGAGLALSVTTKVEDLRLELRDSAPEELRSRTEDKLVELGVEEDAAERFVGHPWYSPSALRVIAEMLDTLGAVEGRGEFIRVATSADDSEEAFFFTRMAMLLAAYHLEVQPMKEIVAPSDLVMALAYDGQVVVPLLVDYGVWSGPATQFLEAIDALVPSGYGDSARVMWVSGTLSPRAWQELGARGWTVRDRVGDGWPAQYDRELQKPGGAAEDRIVPEIGG